MGTDQLNLNVLQYTILCLQSILSIYLIIITNIQIFINLTTP